MRAIQSERIRFHLLGFAIISRLAFQKSWKIIREKPWVNYKARVSQRKLPAMKKATVLIPIPTIIAFFKRVCTDVLDFPHERDVEAVIWPDAAMEPISIPRVVTRECREDAWISSTSTYQGHCFFDSAQSNNWLLLSKRQNLKTSFLARQCITACNSNGYTSVAQGKEKFPGISRLYEQDRTCSVYLRWLE